MQTEPNATAATGSRPHASHHHEHDTIVVGARVAGAATAMLLARRGLRVLLLDRAPRAGTDTLSTHALMRGGVVQLRRWGLLEAVIAAGTPPVRRTAVHYGDEVEEIEIKERSGVSSLYGPRRTVLDPLLVEAAREAGVEVRFGAAVEDLIVEHGRVRGVTGRDRDGHAFSARAAITIGADGLRSRVARRVGAMVTWQGRAASAVLYGYWSGFPAEGYEWFYRPGATAGVVPTNDGRVCIWVGAPCAELPALTANGLPTTFDRLLARAAPETLPRLGDARRTERLRAFPGVPGFLRRPHGPGWALVGDAGAFRDPLSAHGITDALRDAELLSRAVTGTLTDYEEQRDSLALPLARISDQVASYQWTMPELRELLVGQSKLMGREAQMLAELDDVGAVAAA